MGLVTGVAALVFLCLPVLVRIGVIPASEPPSRFLLAHLLLWGGFLLWLAVQFLRSQLRTATVRARADLVAGGLVLLSATGLRFAGAPLGAYLGILVILGLFLFISGLRGIRAARSGARGDRP